MSFIIPMITIIKKGTPKEDIHRKIDLAISKSQKRNLMKFAGKIKFDNDPLQYHAYIREEWNCCHNNLNLPI